MTPRPARCLFYLDTSALRHLLELVERAELRRQIEGLIAKKRLAFVCSLVTLEELVHLENEAVCSRAVAWLRAFTPRTLACPDPNALLLQCVLDGDGANRCRGRFVSWESLEPGLTEALGRRDLFLLGRDEIRATAKQLRDDLRAILLQAGYPKVPRKANYWDDPANLFAEVRSVAGQVLQDPGSFAMTLRPRIPGAEEMTDDFFWRGRRNPWVHLWAYRTFEGVLKQILRKTQDKHLTNDYYDDLHIVFASTADVIVSDDKGLTESISHLRLGAVPEVLSLDAMAVEIAQLA